MRLFHLELETSPPLSLDLHPRLTVIAAHPAGRQLLVDVISALLRGRASGLRGALVADGALADFVVETTSGPALPGAPLVLRAADIDSAAVATADQSPGARARARHEQALEDLHSAESAAAAHEQRVAGLRERLDGALRQVEHVAREGSEPEELRRRLRTFVDELDAALAAPALSDDRRVAMLERGTILAADAARLGVCQPASVRALLETLDALNPGPRYARDGEARHNGTHVPREVVADLEGNGRGAAAESAHAELVFVETELREALAQQQTVERAVASARSNALAVFAELEALRRSGADDTSGYAGALRARLARRGPTSWVGVAPIIVDDALTSCPPADVPMARAVLLEATSVAQVIYLTGDPDTLAWAAQLSTDDGALVRAF